MAREKAVVGGKTGGTLGRASNRPNRDADVGDQPEQAMNLEEPVAASSHAKPSPRKAAPRGKWSEERLLTDTKSELVDANLVSLFADSDAWNCLDESEKREILALLPDDVHPEAEIVQDDPDAKIPPPPQEFLRYSMNWRDGVRQFQDDLANGHFNPEWLRQAEEARKQRANGDFDTFKEQEFEEYWGQKQKMDMSLIAGESAKVKLSQLIQDGVVRIGDVWRYRFVFGKGEDRFCIDKEARIHDIKGLKLSFVVPTGTRTFLSVPSQLQEEPKTIVENGTKADITTSDSQKASTGMKKESTDTKKHDPESDIKTDPNTTDPCEKISTEIPAEPCAGTANGAQEDPQKLEAPANDVPDTVETKPSPQETTVKDQNGPENTPGAHYDSYSSVEAPIVRQPPSTKGESSQANNGLKRPAPQPVPEPPAKRRAGRPLKYLIKEPAPTEQEDTKQETFKQEAIKQDATYTASSTPASSSVSVGIYNLPPSAPLKKMQAEDAATTQEENTVQTRIVPTTEDGKGKAITEPSAQSNGAENPENGNIVSATENEDANETGLKDTDHIRPVSFPLSTRTMSPLTPPPEDMDNGTEQPAEEKPAEPSKPADAEQALETIVHGITSTANFAKCIVDMDGRRPEGARFSNNAWKEIRCYRNNQDIGSLWDVRHQWYLKHQ
ncbi:hypothetical protein N7532_002520 [Penicillium argentinense]|uniref:DEUBAD domain-containing protein n=1 Tax=Penicillium argentinense TaxID=1131581 RepID=A0A9W9KKQ1_9EURO|nr:uncharacterized protein N7532_002520 [Penicillium argentinense]KAJ5109875.1 hypothetical protein N7532_002520 [Penicillium argentinense]